MSCPSVSALRLRTAATYRHQLEQIESITPPRQHTPATLKQIAEQYITALHSDDPQKQKNAINSVVDRVIAIRKGNQIECVLWTSPVYALGEVPPRSNVPNAYAGTEFAFVIQILP